MTRLETVIGLEVHAALDVRGKLFCACRSGFGRPPNTDVCPVCLGLPGAMPALDGEAVVVAARIAAALGCEIRAESEFARKHYFYPDLPKGYQITQLDSPLARTGALEFESGGSQRVAAIERLHLEEDAGKSFHESDATLVDFNRAGVALVEIVTAPCIASPREAADFARALKDLLVRLGACGCRMHQGELRFDANISLRPEGSTALGAKVEVKNVNSFKFLEKALESEVARQSAMIARGDAVEIETRAWNNRTKRCEARRAKEGDGDYRYLPEPDLPRLALSAPWVAARRAEAGALLARGA